MARNEFEVPEEIKLSHPEDTVWWKELIDRSKKRGCLSCVLHLPAEGFLSDDPKIAPWHRREATIRCASLDGLVLETEGEENGKKEKIFPPLEPNSLGTPPNYIETFIKGSCPRWRSLEKTRIQKGVNKIRKALSRIR